jgi:hypothetical protein
MHTNFNHCVLRDISLLKLIQGEMRVRVSTIMKLIGNPGVPPQVPGEAVPDRE